MPAGSVGGDTAIAGQLTVNAALTTGPSVAVVALSCFVPARSTPSAPNDAMPEALVGTGPPPESVPVPTSESETLTPSTGLPDASETFSSTGGEIAAATTTSLGGTANASVAAAPALTVNDALVTGVSAPPVAVSCFAPAESIDSPPNVAIPAPSVVTAPPPVSVPLPTSVSPTAAPATPLPYASATRTSTAGAIVAPATTSLGGTANASVAAAPALTVNDALVTGVSAPLVAVSCFAPAVSSTRSSNSANPLPSVLRLVVLCSVPLPDESATLTPTPDCATSFP